MIIKYWIIHIIFIFMSLVFIENILPESNINYIDKNDMNDIVENFLQVRKTKYVYIFF